MKIKKDGGFTFVETVVTIGIILILSAGTGFSALRFIDKAKTASCRAQIESFSLALQSYYMDCGMYPTESQGLAALWEKPLLFPVPADWNGPYIDKKPQKDPWSTEFVYRTPGKNNLPFEIASFGADKKEGGEGANADIFSWN